jgi:hypothetical protein
MNHIVPPSFLFQYSLQIPRLDDMPGKKRGLLPLPESCSLFVPSQLNSRSPHMSLRMAWNPEGLGLELRLRGKSNPAAGRWSDPVHSDWIQFLVDTRHTASVQRATEYCTSISVMVADDDADDAATVRFTEIAQQRVGRYAPDAKKCRVESQQVADGYNVSLWVPGSQIPGYEQVPETGLIGFYCVVRDTELGELPLSIGDDFPVTWNPSTWIPVELKP